MGCIKSKRFAGKPPRNKSTCRNMLTQNSAGELHYRAVTKSPVDAATSSSKASSVRLRLCHSLKNGTKHTKFPSNSAELEISDCSTSKNYKAKSETSSQKQIVQDTRYNSGDIYKIQDTNETTAVRQEGEWRFRDKSKTAIIFDWDDTLFPSYWFRVDPRIMWGWGAEYKNNEEVHKLLTAHQHAVTELLSLARTMGDVVILSSRKRPWVQLSSKLLPEIQEEVDKIPAFYTCESKKCMGLGIATNSKDDILQAMRATRDDILEGMRSCKNVVLVGDCASITGGDRVKNIQCISCPSIQVLTLELNHIRSLLRGIVRYDASVDVNVGLSVASIEHYTTLFGGIQIPVQME